MRRNFGTGKFFSCSKCRGCIRGDDAAPAKEILQEWGEDVQPYRLSFTTDYLGNIVPVEEKKEPRIDIEKTRTYDTQLDLSMSDVSRINTRRDFGRDSGFFEEFGQNWEQLDQPGSGKRNKQGKKSRFGQGTELGFKKDRWNQF